MVYPGFAGQLGNLHDIASVHQRTHEALPAGDLAVELGGVHGHGLPLRDAGGKNGNLIARFCRHTQRLQVAAAGTAAGVQTVQQYAAALACQQLFRQLQFVLQRRRIQTVVLFFAVQPCPQGVNCTLGYAGGQLRVEAVGKQFVDISRQVMLRVVFHKQQLGQTDPIIVHLLHCYADLFDRTCGIKGQNGKFRHGRISAHTGPGLHGAAVACCSVVPTAGVGVRYNQVSGFAQIIVLVPDMDAVHPQPTGIGTVQTRYPQRRAQAYGLGECHFHVLVAGPIAGRPMGGVIAVHDVAHVKGLCGGVGIAVVVIHVRQTDLFDEAAVQQSLGGNALWPLQLDRLRRSLRRIGLGTLAQRVAGHHIDGVGHAVGQAVDGHTGLCQLAASLLPLGRPLLLVVRFIVCR